MANTITIASAIVAINPSASVIVNDDDFDRITWRKGTAEIPRADIEAKIAELQTIEDNKEAEAVANKASAKAKLIAGEALTEAEADTIVI